MLCARIMVLVPTLWAIQALAQAPSRPDASAPVTSQSASADVLSLTMSDIDGSPVDLARYRGKVVLMVNTASQCGLTPQYEQLESLYRTYKDRGLVVLGFPANNFGGQEPGTDSDIKQFCSERFDVSFPMFSKISVAGDDKHPLYRALSALPEPLGGDPTWNFTKFVVDRAGRVSARFEPRTRPDAPEVVALIERLLADGGDSGGTRGLWF